MRAQLCRDNQGIILGRKRNPLFSFTPVEGYYEQQEEKSSLSLSLSSQFNHHPPWEAKGCAAGCGQFGL